MLLISSPSGLDVWDYWWHHHAHSQHLFTLFLLHQHTLAKQHREVGVHERGSGLEDVDPVKDWDPRWEVENMPVTLPRLSVALHPVPDFLYEALVIARKHDYVNLVFLHNHKDFDLAKDRPKEELSQSLHQGFKKECGFVCIEWWSCKEKN